MYWTLALRHLLVRPGRAFVLLLGYALGVAVMIVLLSIGSAMLDQSRDASLIGGGELTALPAGVDIEAMRTGGLAGMFFGINGARFVTRELLGGSREAGIVAAVSPVLEQKLVAVRTRDTIWTVRAGGELPSQARAAGAPLRVIAGTWRDDRRDSSWRAPTAAALYREIDHFHRPGAHDSSWAEWHYFNFAVSESEWWYVTLLIGGDVRGNDWGGQVLVTHRTHGGEYQRYVTNVGRERASFDTTSADLTIGSSSIVQLDGKYLLRGSAGSATFDVTLTPSPHEYFPAVELGSDQTASGYVVPALAGTASGRFCIGSACRTIRDIPGYHDHNWGSWRAVTWEWGAGRGVSHALLYGGVTGSRTGGAVPFFLGLEDSLGLQQIYRFDAVRRIGGRSVPGMPGIVAPESLRITAARLGDTLDVRIRVTDVTSSRSMAAGPDRVFLQMRGAWRATGTAGGLAVADSGTGFFETWVCSHTLKVSLHSSVPCLIR
jgi:hypothetical protein